MAAALCLILIVFGIFDIVMGVIALSSDGGRTTANRYLSVICFSSALWCMGYALMGISSNDEMGYFFRGLALFGVTVCCGFIILYLQHISQIGLVYGGITTTFIAIGGFISYICVVVPRAVTFVDTPYGRYYNANKWVGRYIQYIYLIILFCAWFYIGIRWYMNSELKRDKATSKYIITAGCVILFGIMFDTVLPIFGQAAFPSSAITTFFSVVILYRGLREKNLTSISSGYVADYIFKNVATPVVLIDTHFMISELNDYACEYLGNEREVLLNTVLEKWFLRISDDERNRLRAEMINRSPEITMEATVRESERQCDINASVLYDRYGEMLCMICLFNDKTKIKKLEEEITKSKQAADLAETAKRAFMKSMSIDITKPIMSFISECDELKQMGVEPVISRRLNTMQGDAELLLSTVTDMLDISQMESGNFVIEKYKYDIRQLLTEIINEFVPRIDSSRVELVTQISASVPRVLIGDRKRIKQVLANLLDNAIKYTKQGYITLSLDHRIRFGVATLHFKVGDTGIGIRNEDLDIIFGSFNQVDKGLGGSVGSGLGLSICRNIVKLMGGEISVQSALGKGTVFSFSIEQKTDSEKSVVPYEDYKDKVLIIDRTALFAESAEQMIKELGIECDTYIMTEMDDRNFPAISDISLVLVEAGVYGLNQRILRKLYSEARLVPIYSYDNYQKLKADEDGICAPLLFAHIHKYLQ